MAGTITFAGIGSGLDVNSIIQGLTAIEQQPITAEQKVASSYRSAVSSLSNLGTLMANLNTAASALNTAQDVGSFTASSSSGAIVASASGSAQSGAYSINVEKVAQEQRTYSDSFASASSGLGLSGALKIGVGAGPQATINVAAEDTLNSLVDKINASGLRVSASTFFDGSEYRLQVRGLDSGDANSLTFDESAVPLGLGKAANTKQQAQSAVVDIDGFQVKSATNQVTGAIPGVTLAVTATTTSPVEVTIASDPTALGSKLQTFVNAYNSAIKLVHSLNGYGQTAAANPALAGDSILQNLSRQLSNTLLGAVGNGQFQTLGSIGVNLQNDGTLALDTSKLDTALTKDASSVTAILAGTGQGNSGVMNLIANLANNVTDPTNGSLQAGMDGLNARASVIDRQVAADQARVAAYATQLRKQFTAMDATVSQYQTELASLTSSAALNFKA